MDVVVVGAGLAGLACALRLTAAGAEVALLEAQDRVGGRVGTDVVDGFRCDRGFQLVNPFYPEVRRTLDLRALRLQPLPGAVVVATPVGRRVLGDPRRTPPALLASSLVGALRVPGSLGEKVAFARWALSCARRDPADLVSAPDEPWGEAARRLGVDGALADAVLGPFLAGTLAEADRSTSRRFVELLVRSFVRGRPSVPWEGMQAIPDQLASRLPGDVLRLGVPVAGLASGGPGRLVRTDAGEIPARAVVVATDPGAAGALTGVDVPQVRPLTTFWHVAPTAPEGTGALHLDGEQRGAIVNTLAISSAARGYSPDGRCLVASTILGLPSTDAGSPRSERGVLRELSRLYGTDASGWDLVATHAVPQALTAMVPPLDVRRPVSLGDGLFVAGDHRDTASQQGALVSGRRAADAVLEHLGLPVPPRPALDQVVLTVAGRAG